MEKLKNLWLRFAEEKTEIAKWVREGGLFFLVSCLITVLKAVFLICDILLRE